MNVAHMRKALVAAAMSAVGALALGLFTEIPKTSEGWVALIVGSIVIGIGAGRATYQVRNDAPGIAPGGSFLEPTAQELAAFKQAFEHALKTQRTRFLNDDER